MSKAAQYLMLSEAANASAMARDFLRVDLAPLIGDRMQYVAEKLRIRIAPGGEPFLPKGTPAKDDEFLAACLLWASNTGFVKLSPAVVSTIVKLAARVFDYPQIAKMGVSEANSQRRKGRPNRYNNDDHEAPSLNERQRVLVAAVKRRGTDDRDIVVGDVVSRLQVSRSQASRLLVSAGWPGSKGRPMRK